MEPQAQAQSPGPASIAEALPRTFGRYILFDHIGRGGMADIYLAMVRDDLLERRLVLKEILPALCGDEVFASMLIAEAKLAAHLRHANVVQVWDLGRVQGRLFIVMEYVEGFDLNQLLRRLSKARIPLPAEFAILVVRDTLRALDYAHRACDAEGRALGIVHRDVSPSNVLISLEGEVKICDFGIARALHGPGHPVGEACLARVRVAGKSAYMAPEHARGEPSDVRADVFSAGILLWELCAGRRLYKGSEEEMLAMARAGEVPPLPERGLPHAGSLQGILDRALAARRGDRIHTAAAFLDELEGWAAGAGLLASQIKFGRFLTDNFGAEVIPPRRRRERSVSAPCLTAAGDGVHSEITRRLDACRAGEPAEAPGPPAESEARGRSCALAPGSLPRWFLPSILAGLLLTGLASWILLCS